MCLIFDELLRRFVFGIASSRIIQVCCYQLSASPFLSIQTSILKSEKEILVKLTEKKVGTVSSLM